MEKLSDKGGNSLDSPHLSLLAAWALAFGCSVGWGAFVMPGTVFLPNAGSLGSFIGLFLGAAAMLVIGINYSALMRRYPDSGGAYTYASRVLGGDHGFLCAWMLIIVYFAVIWANSTALSLIIRYVFGDVLCFGFSYTVAGYTVWLGETLVSIAVICAAFLVCALGKRVWRLVVTVLAVLLFVGICAAFIAAVVHRGGLNGISPAFSGNGSPVSQVFGIVILAPWAYVGFESVSHCAGEFKFKIKKSLPVLIAALAAGALSYVMLTLCAAMATPDGYNNWTEYISALPSLKGLPSLPTFFGARQSMGNIGLHILGISAFCGIATGLIGYFVALSRLMYRMSDDGLLPKAFVKTNKRKTPFFAFAFIGAVSLVMPFLGRTAIGWIVDVTTIGASIVYAYISICSVAIGKREKNRRMMVPGLHGTAIYVIFLAFYLLPSFFSGKSPLAAESFLILIIWCVLGIGMFRVLLERDKTRSFGKSEVVWVILIFLILLLSVVWIFQTTVGEAASIARDITNMQSNQAVKAGLSPDNSYVAESGEYITQRITSFGELVRSNVLVQALLIVVTVAVVFSIFSVIKKRERVIEAERLLAEENSMAKSVFLSNMSHDLRTPMNAVTGYTAIALKEENLPDNIRDYLLKIQNSGNHLLSLINDILDMSRIESGKVELNIEPADICALVDEAKSMFAVQASDKKLRLSASCVNIENRYVLCDKIRLNRILLNLISNAVKYTLEGGSVDVELRQTESGEKASFVFTVSDTGIGMSEEFCRHVFEAYERERSRTVEGIQGTGLGMAITKSLTELMGGTIEVESEEGKGSTFTVMLSFPVANEEEIKELTQETEEVRETSGGRILVVDDNPINREIAGMILTTSGFECEFAQNGQEALDAVINHDAGYFGAVLMDIGMPLLNGYDATREIRKLGGKKSEVPVIACTANTFEQDKRDAAEAGMNDHLAKPFKPETLVEMMRKYV